MATITMTLSQAVVDQQHALALQNGALASSLDGMFQAIDSYKGTINPGEATGSVLDGATLVVHYTSGATETYRNVVLDNPGAATGHGSAGGYEYAQAGVAGVFGAGKINFDYTVDGGNVWLTPSTAGDTYGALGFASDLSAASPTYDPVYGNTGLTLTGNLALTPQGDTIGSFSNITLYAEKFLASTSIDGSFYIDTTRTDGLGGVLTGYHELYEDGSQLQLGGISTSVSASQSLGGTVWTDTRAFDGDDVMTVDLPAHLYAPVMLQSGAGNDRITLKGGGGQLDVLAGAGNDQIALLGDAHAVDGGAGIDTVRLSMTHADATVQRIGTTGSAYTVTDKAGTIEQLTGVERIAFSDATVALDIDGNGGQVYRIYQAAFNRAPDAGGLGYWINAMDHGQSFATVARGFVDSDEYHAAYGGVASNRDLVNRFYENILHRAPDAGGLDFWTGVLDSKAAGTADVLAAISDSAENKDGLIGVIGNGFEYTPYGQG